MDKVDKKIKTYGIILGVILFVLLIAGFTYANLAWNSKSIVISGKSNCLEVESVKGSNITGGNLLLQDEHTILNNNQITIKNGMIITNVTAKIKSTCSISGYMTLNLNVTNLSSAFTSSGNSTGALKYVLASYNPSTYSTISTTALNGKSFDIIDTGSITSTGTIKLKEENLSKTQTKAYLVIFYIDGDMANNDAGSNSTNFKSNLEAIVTQGEAPINAVKLITDLYTNAPKTTTTVNSVTYNLAPSEGLMNDRKGSMSTGIDAGNIRYYGKTKITKVPGWQSDEIFSKYCPPKTCFNSESTCIDFLVNGVFELSETEAKKQCTEEKENVSMVDPNNYIYFNCSDYSNQTSSTCETWRIIGVFDGKVKIMRGSQIGTYSWNTSDSSTNAGYGVNEWSQVDLMKLLNGGYDSESVGGSLYWNAKSGTCYNGINNRTTSCNFTSTGLKNDTTRNLISEETYYTRGHNDDSIYVDAMYDKERVSGTVITGVTPTRTLTWTGKIAIPYPSDYGYAADLSLCQKTLHSYSDSKCTVSNWMKNIVTNNGGNDGWLLTPGSGDANYAWGVGSPGNVSTYNNASDAYGVAPVLSLISELDIGSGTGTSNSPYQLSV